MTETPDLTKTHPLRRPYHVRLEEYNRATNRIFNEVSTVHEPNRSSRRIREYYNRRKELKNCVISSLVNRTNDNRPYIMLNVQGKDYYALLDNGTNVNVVGRELCSQITTTSSYKRGIGNVKTADGQQQRV